jgi:TolB-like protein/Flp pilus assembly protein TadD
MEGILPPRGEAVPRAFDSTAAIGEESRRGQFAGPLAVLPFDNLGSSDEDVYFAAGIHDEILNQLTKITDLKIVSRSSVLPYAGERRAASEIAAELRAGAVLVGSVRYADSRVRIYTQLIDAGTDAQIWSASYERDFEDVFAIQTDIAIHVATALEAQFNVVERRWQEERLTDSSEAYTFYLRAGASAVTPGLPNSVRHLYLDQAIALDPGFAQAHARKADVYAAELVGNFSSGAADLYDLDDMDRRVRTSAETALALDPDLESAYLALGRLHQYRWRWAEAQQAYERAFELAPDNPDVLRALALFDSHMGDHVNAVSLATRTTELIPTQSGGRFRLGTTNLYAADHDSAVAAFRKTIELDPSHTLAHIYLAILQGVRGDIEEALMELQVAERTLGDDPLPHIIALIAYGYSRAGHSEDAERLVRRVETMGVEQPVGNGTCMFIALARGTEEQSLACLRSAVDAIENQIPDVSYHNLMLAMANVFSDPVLEKVEFRALRGQAYSRFSLRDNIELTGEFRVRVLATR